MTRAEAIIIVFAYILLCSISQLRTQGVRWCTFPVYAAGLVRCRIGNTRRSGIPESHLSWNTTFAVVFCATGLPSCVAGLYFQRFLTMVQAASSRRAFPLVVVTAHSLTLPSGLITNRIATVPCSCKLIVMSG